MTKKTRTDDGSHKVQVSLTETEHRILTQACEILELRSKTEGIRLSLTLLDLAIEAAKKNHRLAFVDQAAGVQHMLVIPGLYSLQHGEKSPGGDVGPNGS